MKNHLLILLFVCFSLTTLGQINEVGFFFGGTNYIGDIGRTNYIYPNQSAGALIYKWNWNPRIALRATYSYLPIKIEEDGKGSNASASLSTRDRFAFINKIHELAIGMEFNFFEYDLSSNDKTATPYILVELAGFNYQHIKKLSPDRYVSSRKTSYTIPFGVGYKTKLAGTLAFAIETKISYTFEDDLDFSTSEIPFLDKYDAPGNDWYVFTGISLVYTFGRPSCYTPGL